MKALIAQACGILHSLGIPIEKLSPRRAEMAALCFLAVAGVFKGNWKDAKDITDGIDLKTRDIIDIINKNFKENISSGSYDDIRRKHLKLTVLAGIITRTKPESARNSPTRGYALSSEFSGLIRSYGDADFDQKVVDFFKTRKKLSDELGATRNIEKMQVKISSEVVLGLSPGEHNILQKAIIDDFLPRFGYGAEVLYLGDAANKSLYIDATTLKSLGFFELKHGELPDVIAYSKEKNWIYLVEAVHSFGPISQVRLKELKELVADCSADVVYVTAFLTRESFRKFIKDVAWETEVWIADAPDHMIHFDGEKFLGPY
ncbi:MAG: restriction endonuclease [Desulfovibrio sp.]|nr:restriction endonuclease [Desulfovibrio sp.]